MNENQQKAIICDVDGTIADNSHRQHWVRSKPKNWAAFNATIDQDVPIWNVIEVVQLMQKAGYKLIIVTARTGDLKEDTQTWLDKVGIKPDAYYMREVNDYRDDGIVKSEIYDQILLDQPDWIVKGVFDDRDRVVSMWRQRGLTCFQVAPGDF